MRRISILWAAIAAVLAVSVVGIDGASAEIVIVSQAGLPSESYVIEIESTDTASGITSVYSQLHDKAAGNHSFEMQSTTNVVDDGRT